MKWWFIILLGVLMMSEVSAEIINSRMEETCDNGNCLRLIHSADTFQNYNDRFYYYNETIQTYQNNLDIGFSYIDSTEINLTPVIMINEVVTYLRDYPTISNTPLNYVSIINIDRDSSKFEINFDMIPSLQRIGFEVNTNQPIEYLDYTYYKEGIWTTDQEYSVDTTDLYIGNERLSFTDLIESGFDISYDKVNNILWIDLNNRVGRITADPVVSRFSASTDGFFTIEENSPDSCSATDSTSTTGIVGDDHAIFPLVYHDGAFDFDTSLPVGSTLDSLRMRLYRHSYTTSARYNPPNWVINYNSVNRTIGASLTCFDWRLETFQGNSNWNKVTGTIWKTFGTPEAINITTDAHTQITIFDNWRHIPGGEVAEAYFRTSEFTGTSSDPLLELTYTEAAAPPTNISLMLPLNNSIVKFQECILKKPTEIFTSVGVVDAGDINSLIEFEDGDSYNVSETTGTPGSTSAFNFTDIISFNRLRIRDLYDGNMAHNIDVNLYNYTSNIWDMIYRETDEVGWDWHNVTNYNMVDYLKNGIFQVQFNHTSPGNINHDIYIGYADLNSCPVEFVFNINASDDISNCSLIRDGVIQYTINSTIINGTNNSIWWDSGTLGTHNWNINCTLSDGTEYTSPGVYWYNVMGAIRQKEMPVYPFVLLIAMMFIATRRNNEEK